MENQPIADTASKLIIVPGHAVYEGNHSADAYDATKWVGTYSGYVYGDEVMNYVRHIQRGINLADRDSRSVLLMSGGKTREDSKRSEAESYFDLAEQLSWFGAQSVADRVRLEEFATDSFENLLFSIQLFQMLHPKLRFPQKVTVVGLRFKSLRYHLHADAIIKNTYRSIPPFVFRYDDVNDIPDYVLDAGSAEGEELTRRQFEVWPFGDQGELASKRISRNHHGTYDSRPYPKT
jgi:hypothetical protein